MFRKRPGAAVLILLIVAALSLASGPAQAGSHKGGNGSESSAQISADRAAAIASKATGGRVLKVERKGKVYRVRVLLDGERVRNVSVDANTGRVLN